MLKNLSDQIRNCYDLAEEARQQADATIDPALKAGLLDMERRWLVLARSYGFAESIAEFTSESKCWQEQRIDGKAVSSGLLPDEMLRLQQISTLLIQESDLRSLYDRILDAAADLIASDMASMQEFVPERNELRLLAGKDFIRGRLPFGNGFGLTPGAAVRPRYRKVVGSSCRTSRKMSS